MENQVRLYHLVNVRWWLLKAFNFLEHMKYWSWKIKRWSSPFLLALALKIGYILQVFKAQSCLMVA